MPSYEQTLIDMLQHPPNRNDPLPLPNRRETIIGTTLSLLILSWLAVIFRLWVRIRIVREPGWDDAFVVAAAICNTAATICVCIAPHYGMGQHMLYIGIQNLETYLMLFYIAHSIYVTETAIIKASLLLQFLRIFKRGAMRTTCIVLLVLVGLWGVGFSIVAWVPCLPVRASWHRTTDAKCYGFGFRNVDEFVAMFTAHSASNMAFDLAIFLTPLVLFGTPNLKYKNLFAMVGVFAFGSSVVATSVWRLYSIASGRAATYPYLDFTWHAPLMIILSCIEISLAIMTASVPIFWPILEKRFTAILVSYEVKVTEERVAQDGHGLAYELEHTKSGGEGSVKSFGGESVERLTRDEEFGGQAQQYSVGPDPLSAEAKLGSGFQATVQTKPKPNWAI